MKNNAVRWLYAVPGRKKLYILALMLVQALYGASGVLYALLLRNIVDSAVNRDGAGFQKNVILTVLLVLGQIALLAVIRRLTELSKSTFENLFKARLMQNILRRDYARVSAVHSGEWLNRLTNDTVVAAESYVDILPGLTGMVVKLISAVVMIIALDPGLALMLLPCGAALLILTYVFRKSLKKLHKNVQEKDGSLRIFMQERIGSLMLLRSYGAENQTMRAADEKMAAHKAARMRRNRFSNLCNAGFGIAMHGMYLFGVCWCGYGILLGTVTYGTLTAVTQLIAQIQSPFANITGYLPRFYAMTASAERLAEIEAFEDDSAQDVLSAAETAQFYEETLLSFGLEDADFTYYPPCDGDSGLTKQEMPVVLRRMTAEIRKGEYVAFTGHSGCGKSTVLKLLMCIYRLDGGACFLNTADGRQVMTPQYRRLFAYVPQGNQLMSGTVREIVAFAEPDAMRDQERLQRALKIACADEFVSELEHGADTLLGERGTGLSEGQMQRIAIARAIFSGCPVLLLDESTSALDAETEARLLQNLHEMTDKTVIIVTHRPAALDICDRVLEFTENGVMEKNGKA